MTLVSTSLRSSCLAAAALVVQSGYSQNADNHKNFVIDAIALSSNVEITGKLTDERWQKAQTVQCPFEIQPGENIPAKHQTLVKVLYSAEYLYLGFICKDPEPAAIRAHVCDRDANYQDDFVFVALDPYQNNQRAYEFIVNPLGMQSDLMRTGNSEDPTWDAVWYSKGAITDSGYTVEIAIPFKAIHFPPAEVQDWSMALIRNVPRESRYQNSWTPFDRNNSCSMCQGGTLRGLRGLQETGSLQILPYAAGSQAGALNDESDPQSGFANGKFKGKIGGGVRYSPNPSVSLEGVANPDFSQIESDATQISVNTTFAIFYPEKRPFFLDGADLYPTAINDFYSRMINNPMGAAKLLDKSQHFTFAYIGAQDRNSPFIVPGEEGSSVIQSSLQSFSNIVRAKYDFGTQSYIGAMGTARNFSSAYNYTGGLDWNLLFDGNYSFLGQALLSRTREVNDTTLFADDSRMGSTRFSKSFDGETYGGEALYAQFRRDARNYSFHLTYQGIGPTFQAQDGFVSANDLRSVDFENDYGFYPTESLITAGDVFAEGNVQYNYDNGRKQRWAAVGLSLQLKSQTSLTMIFLPSNEELFHDERFTGVRRGELQVYSAPTSVLQLSADVQLGRFVYHADDPSLGNGHLISTGLVLKPVPHLELDVTYSRSRLVDILTGQLLYDGYISRVTGIYQFSGDCFVRLIGQYDQFNSAIELDPLFSYKLNPFTIFYAGSTHSFTRYGDPFGMTPTERQFFVKLQYLWGDI